MSDEDLVLVIDKASFVVKLHESLLEVDLKKGARKKLEDVLESSPSLRGSLGFIFQNVVPLDVPLKDIESVELDEKKQVKVKIPHRKDITIPLEPSESKELISKLRELIPAAKQREMERLLASKEAKRQLAYEGMESERAMRERIEGKERE